MSADSTTTNKFILAIPADPPAGVGATFPDFFSVTTAASVVVVVVGAGSVDGAGVVVVGITFPGPALQLSD